MSRLTCKRSNRVLLVSGAVVTNSSCFMSSRIVVVKEGAFKIANSETFATLKPYHYIIKQTCFGLNHADIQIFQHSSHNPKAMPFGFEGAGIIEQISPECKRKELQIGDRVCYTTQDPITSSSHVAIHENFTIKLYDEIDDYIGATIRKAFVANMCLFDLHRFFQGNWILVNGATGGVGGYLTQLASSLGINVIGVVGDNAKKSIASQNGCKIVINWKEEDTAHLVKNATKNLGVVAVFDMIGDPFFNIAIECLMYFGKYISIGDLGGKIKLDWQALHNKSIFFSAPQVNQFKLNGLNAVLTGMEIMEKISSGKLNPTINRYDFKNLNSAFNAIKGQENIGCNVIRIT